MTPMPVPEPQQLLNDLEDLIRKSPELERRLPVRPEEPLSRDCCGQSCAPCVYDMYRSELDDWARRCWLQLNPIENRPEEPVQTTEIISETTSSLFTFQPNVYYCLKLVSITPMTSDTNIYRFALPVSNQRLFLPVGTHVIMKGFYEAKSSTDGGQDQRSRTSVEDKCGERLMVGEKSLERLMSVVRQYTPITIPGSVGFMDLMIKLYPYGKMSSFLRRVQVLLESEKEVLVEFRGPYGLFTYSPNNFQDILMLAAGTGLAPMAQVIDHILDDEDDMTRIRLLICCRRYENILLRDRMQEWRRRWNFSVRYILSQWQEERDRRLVKYGDEIVSGSRLSSDHVAEEVRRLQHLETQRPVTAGQPSPSFQVLICGTKAFEKDAMNYLLKAGVLARRIFRF